MLKWINKKRSQKGFTLVELVVVIAILGILAALAVPRLSGFTEVAKERADMQIADIVANAALLYSAANGGTLPDMAKLASDEYITKAYTGADLTSKKYKAGTGVITIAAPATGDNAPAGTTVVVTIGKTTEYKSFK